MTTQTLRLKTTTQMGKVFLGPFTYQLSKEEAEAKLRRLNWLIPRTPLGRAKGEASMELIPVKDFPAQTLFTQVIADYDRENQLLSWIGLCEAEWERLGKGEN